MVNVVRLGLLQQCDFFVQYAIGVIGAGFSAVTFRGFGGVTLITTSTILAAPPAPAVAPAAIWSILAGIIVFVVLGLLGLFGLGLQQRLPISDRDLIVVGMDFTKGE